jgi:20S proteasome subunit alpha 7
VVFAVEKLITSKLHEPNSNNRIFTVDKHVGVTTAGLIADSRKIVKRARDEAADFRFKLNEPIPIKVSSTIANYHVILSVALGRSCVWLHTCSHSL